MISIELLITDVCDILSNSAHTEGIAFIPEFPSSKQDLPLTSPVVSVGVEQICAEPGELQTKLEVGASPSTVKLKLLICVPKSIAGIDCYGVFDKVIAATAGILNKYTVLSVATEQMKYSSTINGLVLPLEIELSSGHAYTA